VSNTDTPAGDHPFDDVAAYALDALDDGERRAVDAHLAGCEGCRDELAGHYETLALLAPEEAPPPALWDRVVAGIAPPPARPVPDGLVVPLRPEPAAPAPVRAGAGRRGAPAGWLAAAAAVIVALGIGGAVGYAAGSSGSPGDRTDLAALAEAAAELPDGQLATLTSPGGDPVARVVADEDGAYLLLDGLENLPEGRAYQLWSLTESAPVSLGMLGRDGTNTVAFRLPPTITELAITEAPTSGDVTPAGAFLAAGPVTRT
jgi:hypothetical protein